VDVDPASSGAHRDYFFFFGAAFFLAGAFFLVAFFIRVILPLHLISRYSESKRGCASFIWRFALKVKKKMQRSPRRQRLAEGRFVQKRFRIELF